MAVAVVMGAHFKQFDRPQLRSLVHFTLFLSFSLFVKRNNRTLMSADGLIAQYLPSQKNRKVGRPFSTGGGRYIIQWAFILLDLLPAGCIYIERVKGQATLSSQLVPCAFFSRVQFSRFYLVERLLAGSNKGMTGVQRQCNSNDYATVSSDATLVWAVAAAVRIHPVLLSPFFTTASGEKKNLGAYNILFMRRISTFRIWPTRWLDGLELSGYE